MHMELNENSGNIKGQRDLPGRNCQLIGWNHREKRKGEEKKVGEAQKTRLKACDCGESDWRRRVLFDELTLIST